MDDQLDIVLRVQGYQDALGKMSQFAANSQKFAFPQNGMMVPGSSGDQSGAMNNMRQKMTALQSAIASGNESDIVDALAQAQKASKGVSQQARQLQGLGFSGAISKYEQAVEDLRAAMLSGQQNMILQARMNLHSAQQRVQKQYQAMQGAPNIQGPAQQLQQAQSFQQWAAQFGTPQQQFDAQFKMQRAQSRFNKAQGQGKDPWSKLLFGFGLGDGFDQGAPGSGQSSVATKVALHAMNMGGTGTSIGSMLRNVLGTIAGLSPAAAIASTAILGLSAASFHAMKALNEFSAARGVSGGTTADIAALTSGYGLSSSETSQMAQGLRHSLFNDPMAIMASSQLGMGMQTPVEWGGDPNSAKILREHIQALRGVKDESEQLRLALMLHLEGVLESIRVSDAVQRSRDFGAYTAENLKSPADEVVARDLNATGANIGEGFSNFVTSIGNMINPLLTMLGQGFGLLFNGMSLVVDWLDDHANLVKAFYMWLTGQEDKSSSAADKMQKAADTMNDAANNFAKPGMYGGGPRARGAIPAHLRGEAYSRAVEGQSMQYGVFVP